MCEVVDQRVDRDLLDERSRAERSAIAAFGDLNYANQDRATLVKEGRPLAKDDSLNSRGDGVQPA